MDQSIPLVISSICAGSLFLAAFLLLSGLVRNNSVANRWLAAFFLALSLLFIQLLLEQNTSSNFYLIYLSEWSRWAIFPSLYMAVYSFVQSKKPSLLLTLHFLPALLFAFFTLSGKDNLPSWTAFFVRYFFFMQGLVYGVLNLRLLYAHKQRIRQLLADKASDLSWLRNLVYAPVVIAVMWLAFRRLPAADSILYLICLGLTLYFISAALRQRIVYPREVALLDHKPKASSDSQRLTPPQIDLLKKRVALVVEQEKPYLDPALNLKMLADRIGISTHELSLVLNQGFGMNFYSYVNGLRAEEAERLLNSGSYGRGDMQTIAFSAGFNSRTTFYAAMKKLKQGEKKI
ncbi:helix-turn-helix domain-containing protein [Pedobacter faecalis]|uniref:helix-turn-helix domain-containing protein n=1 Tax=Pedobacter faecalis TaxID=3041495 RepID=UPI002550FBB6|nr:AraC family transcriptional regulator [Pedobacter sp. ELA7]